MNNELYQRTRNRNNQPNGVLFARKMKNGHVKIGWSMCKFKAGDKFDLEYGLNLASTRAILSANPPIPNSIQSIYNKFVDRSVRYFFKGKNVIVKPA